MILPRGALRALVAPLALLAVVGACLVAGSGSAVWADEPVVEPVAPPEPAAPADPIAPAEPESGPEADSDDGEAELDIDAWLEESPEVWITTLVIRFGTAAIGVLLLVLAWRRFDRVRAGLEAPPPRRTPTLAFPAGQAALLMITFWLGGTFVAGGVITYKKEWSDSIVVQLLLAQLIYVPVALLLIVRRFQLGAGKGWGLGGILRGGLATWCVATALAIPAAMLATFVLLRLGHSVTLQTPILKMLEAKGTATPWLICFLAVVIAPIGEEGFFRGLLYPALRGASPSPRRVWIAAAGGAFIFALIHVNAVAFLPLFALALILTWVFEKTDSLATIIVAHALFNLATVAPLLARTLV